MKSKHYAHGGDLDYISNTYGLHKEQLIDFSGNINPLGLSPNAKEALTRHIECITTYPDRRYTKLRHVLSNYCHCSPDSILVGSGATELISLFIQVLGRQKVMALGPTYSEYEREISLVGGDLCYFDLKPDEAFRLDLDAFCSKLTSDFGLLILCNPNNPTSTLLSKKTLCSILDHCLANNIFVMIDETYIEFCDEPSKASAISLTHDYNNLFVLRGISKFFASPGLRFGYAICSHSKILSQIQTLQNPWSVNSLAVVGVEAMIQDQDYIESSHNLIVTERKRITQKLLSRTDLTVFLPTSNFVLIQVHSPKHTAPQLMDALAQRGFIIRDASSFPFLDASFIRFCFQFPEANDQLLEALFNLLDT